VDRRADVYSLGVILYELLSGELPFRGATRMLLHQVIHDEAPSPRKLNSAIPRDLETITLKCLQKDPGRRYQSAAELSADLEYWLEGKPIKARPVTWMERGGRWCERKPAVAALVLLLLALSIAGPLVALKQMENVREQARLREDAEMAKEDAVIAQKEAEEALAAQLKAEADRRLAQANSLRQATPEAAAIILGDLQSDFEGVQAALQNLLEDQSLSALEKNRVRLGLLSTDREQLEPIVDFLKSPEGQRLKPQELLLIRGVLEPFGEEIAPGFIPLLEHTESRLRAACLLAVFAGPDADFWPDQAASVSQQLVNVLPSELAPYRQLLRPVQQHLVGPLSAIYRDDSQGEQLRSFATDTLADYLSDDPEALFDLLTDADQKQFLVIYNKLAVHQLQAIELGGAKVTKEAADGADEEDKEALAIRKANAAAMLLRLDAPDEVWPLLRHSPDPRVRSYIIHWLSPLGADPAVIVARYEVEPDVKIKRALLVCLGEFDEF